MRYTSTRDHQVSKTSKEGQSNKVFLEEGGLFVLPHLADQTLNIHELLDLDYETIAQRVLMILLPDFNTDSLKKRFILPIISIFPMIASRQFVLSGIFMS